MTIDQLRIKADAFYAWLLDDPTRLTWFVVIDVFITFGIGVVVGVIIG